jgi:HK97 family phage portal protein
MWIEDSFDKLEYAFKDNIYKNIVVSDYGLKGVRMEPDVFHFEFHDSKIEDTIEGLYQSYSKLVAASQSNYKKNNARRGKLNVPTNYPQTDQAQTDLENLLSKKFKRFFEAEGGAVVPLTNGLTYEELSSNIGVKGGVDSRDIRNLVDDIFDFVAMGFQVPPQLLKGNIADTEKAVNNFLTFCINPLAETITDEINRKLYGKNAFLEKTYVKLDTTRIRAVDITDVANALDVLLRCGANNIDDNLRILGREPLDTEWSKARWMTKNYQRIEGGEVVGNSQNRNATGS